MKKVFFLIFCIHGCLFAESFDNTLEQHSQALIRNYQTINQWTNAVNAHKQAISDSTAAIYSHNQILQKSHNFLVENQGFLKDSNDLLERNIQFLEASTKAMNASVVAITEDIEAAQETQKMFRLLKKLPWILGIFFVLLLLPSLILLWAFFDLKKSIKK